MKFRALVSAACLLGSFSAFAQGTADSTCIVAGRVVAGAWAPQMEGVELLGADGQVITSAARQALASVRQARLTSPALLSRCDGDATLALGGEQPGAKQPAPAVGAGLVTVQAVNFPKLRRSGELVELRITVPAERVTMLTR